MGLEPRVHVDSDSRIPENADHVFVRDRTTELAALRHSWPQEFDDSACRPDDQATNPWSFAVKLLNGFRQERRPAPIERAEMYEMICPLRHGSRRLGRLLMKVGCREIQRCNLMTVRKLTR